MNVSERFYRNAKYLAQRFGLRLRDIEAAAGVSVGYLSRISENDTLTVRTAISVAKQLGESVGDMCEKDMQKECLAQDIKDKIKDLQQMLTDMEEQDDDEA